MSRSKRNKKKNISQRPYIFIKGNKFEIDSENKVVYIRKIGASLSHREKAKIYTWANSFHISNIQHKRSIISLIDYCDAA